MNKIKPKDLRNLIVKTQGSSKNTTVKELYNKLGTNLLKPPKNTKKK